MVTCRVADIPYRHTFGTVIYSAEKQEYIIVISFFF